MDDEDEHELEEMVGHIKNAEETARVVGRYKKILKTNNVKIMNIVEKQGQLLQQFKDSEEIFEIAGLSRYLF